MFLNATAVRLATRNTYMVIESTVHDKLQQGNVNKYMTRHLVISFQIQG